MDGFGGVLSFELRGGFDAAAKTIEGVELFQLAAGLRPGLVCLACDQEDPADLIDDLDRALDSLRG